MPAIALKVIPPILTLIALLSCTDAKKNSGRVWEISLENNLGIIRIILPQQLDTFFKWTQWSDCGDPCAKTDYRIQSKSLPIFKESGFYYFPLTDSVEQFTIKHEKITIDRGINDIAFTTEYLTSLKNAAFENQSGRFLIDTLLKINDRHFAAVGFMSRDSNMVTIQMLYAVTTINGNIIELLFESRRSYQGSVSPNFLKTAFEALRTIQISNGRQH